MTAPDVPDGWARPLTPHEARIVDLASRGLTNQEIAERLGRTHHTVKTHMQRIAKIVGCSCRAGIVGACFRAGVIR